MSILPKEYAAAFEEYRYDALGRRILVRSLRAGCSSLCPSGIERYVWDGDQILFEIRRPVATVNDPPGLQGETDIEADSGKVYRLQFPEEDQDPETGEQLYPDTLYEMQAVGRVSYLHGVELDHPLVVDRLELGSDSAYRNLIRVWPFANWQGSYDNGTLSERCPESVCINPRWPGSLTTYQALSSVPPGDPRMWFGSLPSGMRDGSGQTFKRNRYYDATSGRFTQEDPIGLAGGLNLYGFASGDPVNLSDPFGLYTQIQCRTIPSTLGLAAHCGLRVINRRLRINRTIELTRVGDRNTFNNDKDVAQFDESGWMTLQPPGGMSEDEFDLKILGAYDAEARHYRKTHPYYSSGTCENSNRFIRNVVRRAGGAIPGGVDQRRRHWLFGAPGLRHGDCVYDTSPNHPRPLVWGNR